MLQPMGLELENRDPLQEGLVRLRQRVERFHAATLLQTMAVPKGNHASSITPFHPRMPNEADAGFVDPPNTRRRNAR